MIHFGVWDPKNAKLGDRPQLRPALSSDYFYWDDSKNIKISQVTLRNTSFQLSLRIFELPNNGKYTSNFNGDKISHTFECNHEEADTRMVVYAIFSSRCTCCCR